MPRFQRWIGVPGWSAIGGRFGRREVVEARPGKSITHGRNPVGVDEGWGMMTQGRRWGPTLGFGPKSRWDFNGSGRRRSRWLIVR